MMLAQTYCVLSCARCRSIIANSAKMDEASPIRRRQHADDPGSNVDPSSSSVAIDDGANSDDSSKKRRNMHLQLGPLVISGAAIDRAMAKIGTFTSKLTMDTLRPLPLFMGVTTGSPSFCFAADAFSFPISFTGQQSSTVENNKITSRLSRNLHYFATNYAFMALCTILIVALMHPGMLLYVGITWAAWWLHFVIIREDVKLVVMEKNLNDIFTPKRRSLILTAWTVWVGIAKCFKPSLKAMVISSALVFFHALLRDPSKLAGDIVRTKTRDLGSPSNSDGSTSPVLVEAHDAAV